jgi:GH24 family phage-related lysozyme (muramidase)
MPTYFEQSLAQLERFEGCVPWMYLDTRSNVTVGVGLMLPDAASASALGFVDAAGAPSAAQDIEADFTRVGGLAPGELPGFYKAASSPQLPQAVIDAKLSSVLTGFEATVRAGLAGYDAMPDSVKMALLDMAYNLGPHKLLTTYPMMLKAVEAANWAQAAAQCGRGGIGAARNAWTQQQFLAAAATASTAASS